MLGERFLSKCKSKSHVYFQKTDPEELLEEDVGRWRGGPPHSGSVTGSDNLPQGEDQDDVEKRENASQMAVDNRGLIYENRQRLVRVDERTAFIAKIVFGLFLAFVGAVGAGLLLAAAPAL